MSTFGLSITCLHCGEPTGLLTSSTQAGTSTNAVVKCSSCGREYLVAVQMRQITRESKMRRADARAQQKELALT